MGRFDIFPIFIATFASRRVTLIATHSKSQKQTRLPIRYLYFILPFKPLINKEVIKVFQNYINILYVNRLTTVYLDESDKANQQTSKPYNKRITCIKKSRCDVSVTPGSMRHMLPSGFSAGGRRCVV